MERRNFIASLLSLPAFLLGLLGLLRGSRIIQGPIYYMDLGPDDDMVGFVKDLGPDDDMVGFS